MVLTRTQKEKMVSELPHLDLYVDHDAQVKEEYANQPEYSPYLNTFVDDPYNQ